jgi:hypothetical protein
MGKSFLILLLLLAALFTALSFLYTHETTETVSDPGLADLVQRATVHGWPWGYYAEVVELAQLDDGRVAVLEYGDIRWQMLGQTYLAWLIVSMLILSGLVAVMSSSKRRV